MVKKLEKVRRQSHHKCTNCFYRSTGVSKVSPSLHSDGNHFTGNRMFYCFWQHYRDNHSMMNTFSAIFLVRWLERSFSFMLNINILALLLFLSCINKLSTGHGKRYLLLHFCCDVKKTHARCFPKSHLCPDEHPDRKHSCILLKYHPGVTKHCVDLLSDLLHQ